MVFFKSKSSKQRICYGKSHDEKITVPALEFHGNGFIVPEMKKHESIASTIEQEIAAGKWAAGERLPSIRQIAMHCRCSTYPVVQAMEKLELRGCVVHVAGCGYVVSPEKRRRVMLLSTTREGAVEHYYDIFRDEAEKALVRTQIIFIPNRTSWRSAVAEVRRWAPDLVLLDVEGLLIPFHCVRTLLKIAPVVFCNRFEWPDVSPEGLSGVVLDLHRLLAEQVQYLRKRGCRRIRFVPTQDELQPFLKKHLEHLAAENGLVWGEDAFAVASGLRYFSPRWHRRAVRELPDGLMGNDVSVFRFQQILDTVFGPHPGIVKIGSADSIWSHIAGHEFDSFQTPWRSIWRRALSGKVDSMEYIQSELRHHRVKNAGSGVIDGMECCRSGGMLCFRWHLPEDGPYCLLWLSRTPDFAQAVMAGGTAEQSLEIPVSTAEMYAFWRVIAVTPDGTVFNSQSAEFFSVSRQ